MVHMNKSTVCIRWTAFALDVLITIGGSVMLALSIWVYTQDNEYKHITNNTAASACFIALSVIVFIIGILGTCAILLLKPSLLKLYFVLMTILFIGQLSGAIYLYVQQHEMKGFIERNWNKTDDETRILIQTKLKCCSMTTVITSHGSTHDKSCFETGSQVRLKDCYSELIGWIKRNVIILATSAVIVAGAQMFLLASSCRLLASIEIGDRMVKQIKVRPIDTGQATNRKPSPDHTRDINGRRLTEEEATQQETVLQTKIERKEWAKKVDSYKKRDILLVKAKKSKTKN